MQEQATAPASTKKVLTLQQLGGQLPVGIAASGALAKDLATRPWRFKEERELGDLRAKNKDANMFQYVSMILATMLTRVGHHAWGEQSRLAEKLVHISQMWMADVFYAYVWLRIQALGPLLPVKYTCRLCGKKDELDADLNTVEVKTVDNIADALWTYQLTSPLTIRGKTVTKLTLGPARWTVMEGADVSEGMNVGSAKALVIAGSIHAVDELGGAVALVASELDDLTKRDIETLAARIDDNAVGPKMVIDHKCPKCDGQVKLPIDWGFDSFFGVSSR